MSKKEFICQVGPNGRLSDHDRLTIADAITQLPGKMVRIELSLFKKKRSDKQNAFYWKAIVPPVARALRELGNDVNEYDAHEYLKLHVMKLGRVIVGPNDMPEFLPESTADIERDDWSIKMEMIRAWAARELKLNLPLPGERP